MTTFPTAPDEPADPQVDALLKSRIYRDYEQAFQAASGLPLTLRKPQSPHPLRFESHDSPFCVLMARTNPACAECLALQRRLEEEAKSGPKTLKCFAGLCESAAPVRVGEEIVAFLNTGHVLLERPSRQQFSRIANLLLEWGVKVDLKQLEQAYFHTRVMSPAQYEAFLRLLAIFSAHLAACSNQLLLDSKAAEPAAAKRARMFIAQHQGEELSLPRVAAAVNLSARYFSDFFKKAVGISFVEYLTRARVERAKNLLQNPRLRISAIAFESGFRSVSQFNRSFKKITGESPQRFRARSSAR